MSVAIRLQRVGAKKHPYYRIVVTDSRNPRDGRFIEKVGTYNPMLPKTDDKRVSLVADRVRYWLSVGAQPSDRVNGFLFRAGIIDAARDISHRPIKTRKDEKKKTRAEVRAEAEVKAKETAAAEAVAAKEAAAAEAAAAKAAAEAPAEPAVEAEAPAA